MDKNTGDFAVKTVSFSPPPPPNHRGLSLLIRTASKNSMVEGKVKKEIQQAATNSMFIIKLSISTCFGHHYAHHQENKTVPYCMRCSVCVHTAHDAAPQDHNQPQPTHTDRAPHAVGHSLILLMMGIMMPETC